MHKDKGLEFGFINRSLMYGGAGVCGIIVDGASFWVFTIISFWIPISVINLITYSLGTLTSYCINKRYSFKSKTHSLSLYRFYLTAVAGMVLSTTILIQLFRVGTGLPLAKIIATIIAVVCQYAINFNFSLVRKSK